MREQHQLFDEELRIGRSFSGQERNCAFLNLGELTFANVSSVSGLDHIEDGRGLALSDWDLDGDIDFLLTNRNAPMFRFLRNGIQNDNHFVSVKLTGRQSNRDAIGARIRIKPKDGDWLTKTVTAGSGFLSQSSKRITFGLGQSKAIEKAMIQWPDGSEDLLTDLDIDQHYLIEQTAERPLVKTFVRPAEASLQAGPIRFSKDSSVTTYVVPPIRMPLTGMKTVTGSDSEIDFTTDDKTIRYTLVNTWASWCEPCKIELKEFADNYKQLTEMGVQVIAVTTDGLPGQPNTLEDAQQVAEKIKFPFPWGTADATWLDKMALIRGAYYDVRQPYPIPTSFLVDHEGELRIIYQGKIGIQQLRQDLERLNSPPDQLRNFITPFVKRWDSKPRTSNDIRLSNLFDKYGYSADAAFYDENAGPEKARIEYANAVKSINSKNWPAAQRSLTTSVKLDPTYAPAHLNLADILSKTAQQARGAQAVNLYQQAAQHYRDAIRYEPDNFDSNFGLGFVLARMGQIDEAILSMDAASKLAPKKWEAQLAAAKLLASKGSFTEAIARMTAAVANHPENENLVSELSGLLIAGGKYNDSIKQSQTFLKTHPNSKFLQARMGDAYFFGGQASQALKEYSKLNATPLLSLKKIWIHSTTDNPDLQNKELVEQYIRSSMAKTPSNDPLARQVLAAALAQTGDFNSAYRMQVSVSRMFRRGTAQSKTASHFLQNYQNKKPARQTGSENNPFSQSILQGSM